MTGTSTYDRILAVEPSVADAPRIDAEQARALGVSHRINAADPDDRALLCELFGELLGEHGEGAEIRPPARVVREL